MAENKDKKLDLSSLRSKISSKLQDNSNKNSKKAQKKKNAKDSSDGKKVDEDIRREALALGASEEDLELIQGLSDDDDDAHSEQEFDAGADEGTNDKGFNNDLQSFMKDIGFDKHKLEDVDDEDGEDLTKSEEPKKSVQEKKNKQQNHVVTTSKKQSQQKK